MSRNAFARMVFAFGFLIHFLTLSCATMSKPHAPAVVPVVFQPIFQNCWPADRDAVLTVKKMGTRVFQSNLVWSIPDAHSADVQFNSILGDTVFQLSRRIPKWEVAGPKDLHVSENIRGTVTVNGFDLPILAEELGCVLADHRLPIERKAEA